MCLMYSCIVYLHVYTRVVKVFDSLTYITTSKTLSPTSLHLYHTFCLVAVFTWKSWGEKKPTPPTKRAHKIYQSHYYALYMK